MPQLNPNRQTYHDNLSLTHRCQEKNKEALEAEGEITFDPSVTAKSDLLECFRVLVDPSKISNSPAKDKGPREE